MPTPRKVIQQRYREQHPERVRASDEKWRAKDPERAAELARENTRRYREAHREEIRARQKAAYVRGSQKPHLTDAEKQRIDEYYARGLNFLEIAQTMGRNGQTIARYLRSQYEIRVRPVRSGPGASNWKGGRVQSHDYVYVWLPPDDVMAPMRDAAGRVAEHRLVLAQSLERPLLAHETVHHINGDPTDNRAENLQLRMGRHGKHIALHCLDCGSTRIGPAPLRQE